MNEYISDAMLGLENQIIGLQTKNSRLEEANRILIRELEWAVSELQSWLEDQGDYGTYGYEDKLPQIKVLLKEMNHVAN